MGENVRKGQVKQFEKGRDRALREMSTPILFARPDIVTKTYVAQPVDGCRVHAGDVLLSHPSTDGAHVNLANGDRVVAVIGGDGAKELIGILREPGSPGAASMQVLDVSEISGFITTAVARPSNE